MDLLILRSFYADFNDANGRRCSKDVKREVQKLIAESVDGIVIDLRFNGGGSLSDVVDMSWFVYSYRTNRSSKRDVRLCLIY